MPALMMVEVRIIYSDCTAAASCGGWSSAVGFELAICRVRTAPPACITFLSENNSR